MWRRGRAGAARTVRAAILAAAGAAVFSSPVLAQNAPQNAAQNAASPPRATWSRAAAAARARRSEVPVPKPTGEQSAFVPDYVTYPAVYALRALGTRFQVSVVWVHSDRPRGIVDGQTPRNQTLPFGSTVTLYVSDGTPPPTLPPSSEPPAVPPSSEPQPAPSSEPPPVAPPSSEAPSTAPEPAPAVPAANETGFIRDFEGVQIKRAEAYLEKIGFPANWSWAPSDAPRGVVVWQDPRNVRAPLGTPVTLSVSSGPQTPKWLPLAVVAAAGASVAAVVGLAVRSVLNRRRLKRLRDSVACSADPPVLAPPPQLEAPAGKPLTITMRVERVALAPSLQQSREDTS